MGYDGTIKIGTELDGSGLKRALRISMEQRNPDSQNLVKLERMRCLFLPGMY